MLCQSLLYSKVTQVIHTHTHTHTHTCIHTFFLYIFFLTTVYHRILNIVSMLYSRTLLFIPPIYNSLTLLILKAQSFPSLPPPPWYSQVLKKMDTFKT